MTFFSRSFIISEIILNLKLIKIWTHSCVAYQLKTITKNQIHVFLFHAKICYILIIAHSQILNTLHTVQLWNNNLYVLSITVNFR